MDNNPLTRQRKVYTTPVALVERDRTRFLVAAFGEVGWVRNLRAAGSAQFTRGQRTEASGVIELGTREAAPILKQFLTSYHLVPFIAPYFDVTARSPLADFEWEATRHPVFRIESSKKRCSSTINPYSMRCDRRYAHLNRFGR